MRKLKTTLLCLHALLLVSSASWASGETPNISAGKDLYISSCSSCHGDTATGIEPLKAPNLAGQHQSYLSSQLNNFASGARGSSESDVSGLQMAAISKTIAKTPAEQSQSFNNVSAYLSSLEKPAMVLNNQKTASGNGPGYKIYQASCGACHGADASGNARLNSPSLAGLSQDYLLRQYQHFLDGSRGSGDGDKYGRQMSMIAKTLTDKGKIDAVLTFIVSLNEANSNDDG